MVRAGPPSNEKARRRADWALLVAYHEAKLAELLEHVREGFDLYDAGENRRVRARRPDPPLPTGSKGTLEVLFGVLWACADCGWDASTVAGAR